MTRFSALVDVAAKLHLETFHEIEKTDETSVDPKLINGSSCLNDRRNLTAKELLDKYAEANADELKRRFSYKCKIKNCSTVFESYGNEKKAFKKMHLHLNTHKNEVSPQKRARKINNDNTFSTVIHKKTLKSQHVTGIKVPAKTKQRNRRASTPKKIVKVNEDSRSLPHYKNNVQTLSKTISSRSPVFAVDKELKDEKLVVEEMVQDVTVEICGPLCSHSNCSLSKPSTSKDAALNTCYRCFKEDCTFISHLFYRACFLVEHNYAMPAGSKKPQVTPLKWNDKNYKKKSFCPWPKQLTINTPSFPYVHVPVLPDCSEIKEIGAEESFQHPNCSDICESSIGMCQDKDSQLKTCNKIPRTKEVLECLENRVDVPTVRVLTDMLPDHCIENSENVQKAVKEKALKCISKLKAKKKKQYQGPLECQICKHKKFTALATLIHHYRSHAGIKPYSCKLCGATFTRKHSLNYHMLIHENISRFTCSHCFRTFRHPSHFKEHMRRHTGETPYVCPLCFLKFKTRNTFKRHLRMQHGKLLIKNGIVDMPSRETEN